MLGSDGDENKNSAAREPFSSSSRMGAAAQPPGGEPRGDPPSQSASTSVALAIRTPQGSKVIFFLKLDELGLGPSLREHVGLRRQWGAGVSETHCGVCAGSGGGGARGARPGVR